MEHNALMQWRKAERARLIAARLALAPETLEAWRHSIDTVLERAFPGLAGKTLALCWPIKNEYDARHLASRLRGRGAQIASKSPSDPRCKHQFGTAQRKGTGRSLCRLRVDEIACR